MTGSNTQLTDLQGNYELTGITRDGSCPREIQVLNTFVVQDVEEPKIDASKFSLKLPYPDFLFPFRMGSIQVRDISSAVKSPISSGSLPLVLVLQYANVNLWAVSIPNLWTAPPAQGPYTLACLR